MAKHGKVVVVKIGINGFGRIGRLALRAALKENMEVVGINDITDSETLAYLFKYDSIHGRFDGEVKTDGNSLLVDGKKIQVSSERDPSKLNWGKRRPTCQRHHQRLVCPDPHLALSRSVQSIQT